MDVADLKRLDSDLDSFVPTAELSKLHLESVVCHLLFLSEIGEKTGTIEKLDHNAIDIAVSWAHFACKAVNSRRLNVEFERGAFRFATSLYHQARSYHAISSVMYLLFKNKLSGRRSGNIVETELAQSFDISMAAAESILFTADDPTFTLPDNAAIASHYAKCKRREIGNRRLQYTLPPELFETVLRLIHEITDHNWQLDPTFDVGGYSLAEYRRFSECLAALAQIHHYCNAAAPLQKVPLNSIWFNTLLKMMSKARWQKLISRLTGLGSEVVNNIIDDITFDKDLLRKKKHGAGLLSLPFLSLTTDLLVLSNRAAFESNAERNYWKLLSIVKPSIHSKLSLAKEGLQLQELETLLRSCPATADLKFLTRFNVQNDTNLDLLLLDATNKFGLALELKWPYGPAYFREMENVWEDLN